MRKTQICVRAALAIQHVLHDIASGSVLRIDSRKRVIVTNRFFAKVKYISYSLHVGGRMQRVIRSSNLTLHTQRTHTRLSTHYYIRTFSVCYQRIPKYTQRTTMYAPTHNTKSTQRTVYALPCSYLHNYIQY